MNLSVELFYCFNWVVGFYYLFYYVVPTANKDNNNNNNNSNNNNNNKRVYPNPHSGQRVLALIGWFKRAVILCGGTKAQKQQSHHSNSGCWTGVLVTLIGRLCGTDPYSFMKEHVISMRKSHVKQVLCTKTQQHTMVWQDHDANGIVYVLLWINNEIMTPDYSK